MPRPLPVAPVLTACVLAVGLAAPSGAARFDLAPTDQADTVSFRSTASLEFIEGQTTSIEGGFDFDPAAPSAPATGLLRVDLRTLKTGIDLRDQHMRERHLETDRYPYAFFQLGELSELPEQISPGDSGEGRASGWFAIHGVRRPLVANFRFRCYRTPSGDTVLAAAVSFKIDLEDYKVKRPKALFLKLAETIEVEVVFHAQTNRAQAKLEFPVWARPD